MLQQLEAVSNTAFVGHDRRRMLRYRGIDARPIFYLDNGVPQQTSELPNIVICLS